MELHKQLMVDVDSGRFEGLDILHHISAGFKAFCTQITKEGIESVRQNCGGAGFNAWSGLP